MAPAFRILNFRLNYPDEGYKLRHGTSFAAPFVAGIGDLMLSVNRRMGLPIDINGNVVQTTDGLDVQRKVYDIITFTATKLIDNGLTINATTPPSQPEYVEYDNDQLKRWWAQRMGLRASDAWHCLW